MYSIKNMAQAQLTPSLLSAALEGLEIKKTRIDEQIAEVRAMLSPGTAPKQASAPSSQKKAPKKHAKRNLSEAARERIADAQRKRWDAYRKNKEQA